MEVLFSSGPSYWVGLYQLSEESFTWAATCQTATTNSLENYDTDIWQPGNHCFRHRPGNAHRGETAPCSIQFPFLCQKYLDEPCDIVRPLYGVKVLIVPFITIEDCEDLCMTKENCSDAIFSSLMDACYVLDGTPGGNAYMTLISKQCLKVSLNESTVQYSSPDFSDIPNTSCIEATTVVPTQSSTLSITPTSAFPTCACEMTSQQSQHGYSTGQVMTSTSSCTLTSYVISMLPISSVTSTILHASSTSSYMTSESVTSTSPSLCPQDQYAVNAVNITEQQASVLAKYLAENLTIDAKHTSAYVRKLSSADDLRRSSKVMGWVGIICVSLPLFVIFLSDLKLILAHLKMLSRGSAIGRTELPPGVCRVHHVSIARRYD
ncbi:uncharacterized protein LOC128210790 [Mya arenaria]|uniref:uncharacterized protein LOC128210790 n=1 Tax=Mya arenaria TaxID=6604 RepID=UPI0022E11915|nr:uncharacterized protein LOC128210790 [Mya arenaria]